MLAYSLIIVTSCFNILLVHKLAPIGLSNYILHGNPYDAIAPVYITILVHMLNLRSRVITPEMRSSPLIKTLTYRKLNRVASAHNH